MKKIINYTLICIFFITSILAKAQCTKGDCKNGKGTFVYPSGATYIGDFRNGEINGSGVCVYKDGSRYEGQWVADRKSVV